MHFLMMISDTHSMLFQTELLIRSIKEFATQPVAFSVVVQGNDKGKLRQPLPLVRIDHKNKYLSANAEILYCPYFWKLGAPCRWFIEPQMDTCVFIDVDVIACNDLTPLHELEKGVIHGVTAHMSPLGKSDWRSIGINEGEEKYYFNMGMVVVPSAHMKTIGTMLFDVYPEMSERFSDYYSGQISLNYIGKQLGITRNALPPRFNWYDKHPSPSSNILFLHYFSNRDSVKGRNIKDNNEYTKLIRSISNRLF